MISIERAAIGIGERLVRMSVGVKDITADLEQALKDNIGYFDKAHLLCYKLGKSSKFTFTLPEDTWSETDPSNLRKERKDG